MLEGGLHEVEFHINAMRDGDLTTQPRAWGGDEAARLMLTLAAMQAALRRIASIPGPGAVLGVREETDTISPFGLSLSKPSPRANSPSTGSGRTDALVALHFCFL